MIEVIEVGKSVHNEKEGGVFGKCDSPSNVLSRRPLRLQYPQIRINIVHYVPKVLK